MSATRARSTLDSATQVSAAWLPGSLLWRVAVLSVAVVFVQIGVVSEVPVFGVSVDLSPLLVAFTGLLCGSLVGAVAGFAVGLLLDLSLVQTLGITSLTFTMIGYGAGRLRELRDPQAALTPLLVGTAAAACAMVGYSLIEFLLGVDAPVSLELLREIVIGVAINAVLALPMWALVRRCLIGGLAEDPRRRRRRAYTTGGLSPISRASGRRERSGGRGGDGSRSAGSKTPGPRLLTRASERER
jgi:rod shape-determining protein MreD